MDIEKSFSNSLTSSRLPKLHSSISDHSIDSILSSDLLKVVPIVSAFSKLVKVGLNIQDKLFLKKILSFLEGLDDIDIHKRKVLIDEIERSEKYKTKVGEKLLYIIDSCSDHENSARVSRLFGEFLEGSVSYDEFIEAAGIISKLSKSELDSFLDAFRTSPVGESARELVHTGLVYFEIEDIQVDISKFEPSDWDDPPEGYNADVFGGEAVIAKTSIGGVVYRIFS